MCRYVAINDSVFIFLCFGNLSGNLPSQLFLHPEREEEEEAAITARNGFKVLEMD